MLNADAERTVGPEWRRMGPPIPMPEPREPSKAEREVYEFTHLPPRQWCEHCVTGRGVQHPHKQVTLERAESLPEITFDVCFIEISGSVSGVVVDEGATCLVLVDVDAAFVKRVPASAKTVTDFQVEGGRRFVEQFFQKRARLRCDAEPATVALAGKLKELLPELVVWERASRHDSPANQDACEQVKMMRLDSAFWYDFSLWADVRGES